MVSPTEERIYGLDHWLDGPEYRYLNQKDSHIYKTISHIFFTSLLRNMTDGNRNDTVQDQLGNLCECLTCVYYKLGKEFSISHLQEIGEGVGKQEFSSK